MDTRGSSYEAPGSQICSKKKRGETENRGRRQRENRVKNSNQEHVHQKDFQENCGINAATHDENLLMLSKLSPNILFSYNLEANLM